MRFTDIPADVKGEHPMSAMCIGILAGIIGGAIVRNNAEETHEAIYGLIHHLAGLAGYTFGAADDERFVEAVTQRLRSLIAEARNAKACGHKYVPDHLLPTIIRTESIGAQGEKNDGETGQPTDPAALAASERAAAEALERIRRGGG